MSADQTILEMSGIDKHFPGVQALAGVDFAVRRGEVHALMGGNGAGKSTLIKVLTGVHRPDAGTIRFDGQPFAPTGPAEATHGGISAIHQEIHLVRSLSVAENLALGRWSRRWFGLDWRRAHEHARTLLGDLGVHVDVTQPLGNFPVGVQQMVAIARAVDTQARLIVMDEPTSSLDRRETERFFEAADQLRRRGLSLIFVTHFLDQVYRISDRISILRNGRLVGVFETASLPRRELVAHMLGREPAEEHETPKHQSAETQERRSAETAEHTNAHPHQRWGVSPRTPGEERHRQAEPVEPHDDSGAALPVQVALSARGLGRRGAVEPFDLDVPAGRVIGLAGLLGSGRTELARLLFGADRADRGQLRVAGRTVRLRSPRQAVALGIGLTPEDRQADGLIAALSVRENIVLAMQRRLSRFGLSRGRRQQQLAREWIDRLGIVVPDLDAPVRNLSGGNQQKVLLARWLACRPRVLILDEPTRGIDVGAKVEVERLTRRLGVDGLAVVFISAELDEVARVSDGVLVLRDRKPVAWLDGAGATEQALMDAIAGTTTPPANRKTLSAQQTLQNRSDPQE